MSDVDIYIAKMSAPEDRFDMYMQIEQWQKAAEVAMKLRDPNRLIEVNKTNIENDNNKSDFFFSCGHFTIRCS